MQFRQHTGKSSNSDDSVLPLINVVFLLLIFFMLAGQLAAGDPFAIDPPKSQSEGQNSPQDMLILVSADGRFALDGVEMSEESVIETASQRLKAHTDAAKPTLRLKADGGTPANRIVRLMQRLREAGFQRLKLLTVPET
ncbi:ExbD/TolR family protein [Denitrobaculum tricleocarpae]|uniref:Biopolymer transporter ExbD n=1 Tax=Denitrobaculum tricleocarpae TaxID=2591009 RepID=A0A545TGF4_9PROT|nr:biopolymer transporter ExbD [Denitrobaculum tricleocarpae]TQV76303.1 biopolymer transporter ExbD [Denitrobaculum tricleocarpae]